MDERNRPTREQFKDYLKIKDTGTVNMFDIPQVCRMSETGLSNGICLYIMTNFSKLLKEL